MAVLCFGGHGSLHSHDRVGRAAAHGRDFRFSTHLGAQAATRDLYPEPRDGTLAAVHAGYFAFRALGLLIDRFDP